MLNLTLNTNLGIHSFSLLFPANTVHKNVSGCLSCPSYPAKRLTCFAESRKSDAKANATSGRSADLNPKRISGRRNKVPVNKDEIFDEDLPKTIPKRPRRGRKSEAAAVEDFVRDSLERTFTSIHQQNSEILKDKENMIKEKVEDDAVSNRSSAETDDDESDDEKIEDDMLVEEDDPDWPLDADVGWGIRASEYFDQHAIKNVVGDDGTEIDWEGEIDDGLVKEINCLEWESFAFHPSPLVVLVFERYNRASQNWQVLKELEKAAKVFWEAKDRLPPRTIKIDINIERDLAYALKVKECPQVLFLRGNRILHREKETRTSDELVQMIAHFYYNAKKPSFLNDAAGT